MKGIGVVEFSLEQVENMIDLLSKVIPKTDKVHARNYKKIKELLREVYNEEIDCRVTIMRLDGIDYDDYY
jgi:diketogulonate reductase-like aldo/keto reductase